MRNTKKREQIKSENKCHFGCSSHHLPYFKKVFTSTNNSTKSLTFNIVFQKLCRQFRIKRQDRISNSMIYLECVFVVHTIFET